MRQLLTAQRYSPVIWQFNVHLQSCGVACSSVLHARVCDVRGIRQASVLARGGELGVLRVREHPLVAKSTPSILKKNFIKHFIILRSNKNMMSEVRIRPNPW